MYKCSHYILQIYKLFAINTPLYVVNIHIYILQIYTVVRYKHSNMCILQVWCYWCRARRGFFSAKNTPLFFWNTESWVLCLRDIKYALFMSSRYKNMLGAPPSMPAGAFISPKNRPYIFWTRNIAISVSPIHKVAFRVHETIVWDTPPDPGDPAEVVSLSAAQTLPSHAPGVRMTVVINILPQTIFPAIGW